MPKRKHLTELTHNFNSEGQKSRKPGGEGYAFAFTLFVNLALQLPYLFQLAIWGVHRGETYCGGT